MIAVLMSGGLDSLVTLAMAIRCHGNAVTSIRVNIPSVAAKEERRFLKKQLRFYGIKKNLEVSLGVDGALAKHPMFLKSLPIVPSSRSEWFERIAYRFPELGKRDREELYVVPMRNLALLSATIPTLLEEDVDELWIGFDWTADAPLLDKSPKFVSMFQRMIDEIWGKTMVIVTPLMRKSKEDIIKKAIELNVPMELAYSCYSGTTKACGHCNACFERSEAFDMLDLKDPFPYHSAQEIHDLVTSSY